MKRLLLFFIFAGLSSPALSYSYDPGKTTQDVVDELARERESQAQEERMRKMERAQKEMEQKMKAQEWEAWQEQTRKTLGGN